ncbi:MAG: shikimate dehydrogenase [Rickettsiales bacterium]|jgi:shikimate dehydrogenase
MNFDFLEKYTFTPKTRMSAVLGDPIAQSLSPYLHNHWLKKDQIDGIYIPLKVTSDDFIKFIKNLPSMGFSGCNITIPHKESALKICDNLSQSAREIGAVNTISFDDDGKIFGDNSDHFGFIQNIKTSNPDFDFKGKSALILGAGGASRAIIYGLLQEGIEQIIIANRSRSKAENLAKIFPRTQVIDWEKRSSDLDQIDLLINSTSLGMKGSGNLEIDLSNLKRSALVSDIVYKPLMTNLLTNAKKRGNPIVTGIGMLIYQGMIGFEEWFGKKPEVTQELIEEMIKLSSK